MIYLDTSALVPLFVLEARSAAVPAFIRSVASVIAVSAWTRTELASALQIKVRTGHIAAKDAAQHMADFDAGIGANYEMHQIVDDDFVRGAQFVVTAAPLRAADALHLAIAHRLGAEVFSLDDEMVVAARVLGLTAHQV